MVDKKKIIKFLEKLNFVEWDRYFGKGENLSFFGWIDRDKDNKKDFVLIEFNNGKIVYYGTSSKEYSKEIADVLGKEHTDCKRVEDFCNISNMIKLKKINT